MYNKKLKDMFDNWTKKKTIWTLVIIGLIIAAYHWRWIAKKLGFNLASREYSDGGFTEACTDNNPKTEGSCAEEPRRTSTGIPIERVPTRIIYS